MSKRIKYFETDIGNHALPAYAQDGCCSAETHSALCQHEAAQFIRTLQGEGLFKYAKYYAANLYAYNCVTNFVGITIELDVGDDLAVVAARWAER